MARERVSALCRITCLCVAVKVIAVMPINSVSKACGEVQSLETSHCNNCTHVSFTVVCLLRFVDGHSSTNHGADSPASPSGACACVGEEVASLCVQVFACIFGRSENLSICCRTLLSQCTIGEAATASLQANETCQGKSGKHSVDGQQDLLEEVATPGFPPEIRS